MDFPGKDLFKEIFENFAKRHDVADLSARVIRSAGAGAKAGIDKALQEFPKPAIEQLAQDIYGVLSSKEVAEKISDGIRSFDEAKINSLLQNALAVLKRDVVADRVVEAIKNSPDIDSAVDALEEKAQDFLLDLPVPDPVKSAAFVTLKWVLGNSNREALEKIRTLPDDEAKEAFGDLVDTFPTDRIALIAAQLTKFAKPELIVGQTQKLVANLPDPATAADIAHDLGKEASQAFGRVSTSKDKAEAKQHVDDLRINADKVLAHHRNNAGKKKKTPAPKKKPPGRGGFENFEL